MAALMLNPSIADETDLDPTLTRVSRYAQQWGYGGMRILNAFSYVSTDPKGLASCDLQNDLENDAHILAALADVNLVMVGWGANLRKKHLRFRVPQLHELLEQAKCPVMAWRITQGGEPSHPLYLKSAIEPVAYPPDLSNSRRTTK